MTDSFCRVGILPTLHALHKDPDMAHYNYEVLKDLVLSSAPAAVLGEIRPQDWEAHLSGRRDGYLGPVEYRECLLPLLEEHGIPFVPMDFYDERLLELVRLPTGPAQERSDRLARELLHTLKRKEMGIRAVLDLPVEEILREKHKVAQEDFPHIEGPTWQPRNLRMAAHIAAYAADHPGKKVLVTVGLEHVPFLRDFLEPCPAIRVWDLLDPDVN